MKAENELEVEKSAVESEVSAEVQAVTQADAVMPNIQLEPEKTQEVKPIEIYTDGACSGNPGPGGFGAIILNLEEDLIEISGGEKLTTNNKMELMGAISALKFVKDTNTRIKLYTDSQYLQKGITEWIESWKQKAYKDVKNVELWKELDALSSKLSIEWHWVKAHNGHKYNEMADSLAKVALNKHR